MLLQPKPGWGIARREPGFGHRLCPNSANQAILTPAQPHPQIPPPFQNKLGLCTLRIKELA
jgi:hypothetical protein